MIRLFNIHLPLTYDNDKILTAAANNLSIPKKNIKHIRLSKKNIDARNKTNVHFVMTLDVELDEVNLERKLVSRLDARDGFLLESKTSENFFTIRKHHQDKCPVVIGMGPAGLFASLTLIKHGVAPIILERGKPIEERIKDVNEYWNKGASAFSRISNVQFGEGGAGTFSDGKLNSGIKSSLIDYILETFVHFGAPNSILTDAKPHIGTDKLYEVLKNIRHYLLEHGAQIHFETMVSDFIYKNEKLSALHVIEKGKQLELECDHAILAIGHSSRDTFESLLNSGLELIAKPFSFGVRIEHAQEMINKSQYGQFWNHPALGPADYKLSVHLPNGRSVYTFCMCPGGTVVASASEENTIVTNGMSVYSRDGKNANSALLVGIDPSDFPSSSPLAGMYWQREIESKAYILGGRNGNAPCQLVGDFLSNEISTGFKSIKPTYKPGVTFSNLHKLFPPFFSDSLLLAFPILDKKLHGFAWPEAIMTAPETRSSSPVRILRNPKLESTKIQGLYPCGEGAGYAGGITSAAIDGIRCAEALLEKNY